MDPLSHLPPSSFPPPPVAFSHHHNPDPPPNPRSNPSPAATDISSALASIKSLVARAESAITSIPGLPPSLLLLTCCPYDRRHRVPPESLFIHSLRCPSAPGAALPDLDFIASLRYPATFLSHPHPPDSGENHFTGTAADDVCFSLDFTTNFFYEDCPGVVSFPAIDQEGISSTFTLPAFLLKECAKPSSLGASNVRILPSELWFLQAEVQSFADFPVSYSYNALRVATTLYRINSDSIRWLLSVSPKYGILIDQAMARHIYLLIKLCLKAIRREALASIDLISLKKNDRDCPSSSSFNCPHLAGSLMWLSAQLSVLYGETNGNIFSLELFRELLMQGGVRLMLFGSKQEEEDPKTVDSEDSCGEMVSIAQVAAAVSALHERFMLEKTINAWRFGQQVPLLQRFGEYVSLSARASKERKIRPTYRAIIENDGLLFDRGDAEESGRVKSKEERLADERDYKRRRMSYRGKTTKRNPTEVLRDIIEDHMEEIRHAAANGHDVNAAHVSVNAPLYWDSQHDYLASNVDNRKRSKYDKYEVEYHVTSGTEDSSSRSYAAGIAGDLQNSPVKLRRGTSSHREDKMKVRRVREINMTNSHFREQYECENEEGMHGRSYYFPRSKDYGSPSDLSYGSAKYDSQESRIRNSSRYRSESVTGHRFEDRYNPSESYDKYDTSSSNISNGSIYAKPKNFQNSAYHGRSSDRRERHSREAKRHKRDY